MKLSLGLEYELWIESDFECSLWPLKAISERVMKCNVPLFLIGLTMFKMAFFCRTSRFGDSLASGSLLRGYCMGSHALSWVAGKCPFRVPHEMERYIFGMLMKNNYSA